MLEINEPIPPSTIATTMEECEAFIDKTGYPVIIRPAYTLGGTGGGFAYNDEDLKKYAFRLQGFLFWSSLWRFQVASAFE